MLLLPHFVQRVSLNASIVYFDSLDDMRNQQHSYSGRHNILNCLYVQPPALISNQILLLMRAGGKLKFFPLGVGKRQISDA